MAVCQFEECPNRAPVVIRRLLDSPATYDSRKDQTMRAQVHRVLTLASLCCLISCLSSVTFAQMAVNASSDLWNAVQATPSRAELEIQLDDGTQLKGRLLTATAGMLRLSRAKEIVEVQRDRIVKIYELSPKPEELRRLVRNASTITGVAGGFEIAKDKRAGFFLIPAAGGTVGAFGGYAFGNRMKTRFLIYDANPRQVTESPSSKPDKSQTLTRPRTIDRYRRI